MWNAYIDWSDFGRRHKLMVGRHDSDGGLTVISSVTLKKFGPGDYAGDEPPLFEAQKPEMKQFLQAIVDMAWAHFRISPTQSQGEGAHLADMRALVAKLSDTKLPGVG